MQTLLMACGGGARMPTADRTDRPSTSAGASSNGTYGGGRAISEHHALLRMCRRRARHDVVGRWRQRLRRQVWTSRLGGRHTCGIALLLAAPFTP